MFAYRITKSLACIAIALFALTLVACGASQQTKVANVQAGDLPVGGDWMGVYYSPVYGYLHLVKEGNSVSGKWRTADGSAWGEMHGTVTGNLLKYEWTEHKIGLVGPSATSKGRGYFKYLEPKEGEAHEIQGEWGLGQDETGSSWQAVKQQNMRADPDSVMPDELEGRGVGGGWDDGEGQPKPSGGEESEGGEGEGGGEESGGDLE